MSVSTELPIKCQQCAKSTGLSIHDNCVFCREIDFQEEVLCHLNRCIQSDRDFKCGAFQPALSLVTSSGAKVNDSYARPKQGQKRESIKRLLSSDRIKYKKALALQKLKTDPDGVFIDVKYHFAWNVIHRRPIFSLKKHVVDFTHDTFLKCSELAGGFTSLLWLAPDHVHLYADSDGERSVETMVQEIKRFSEDALLVELTGTMKKLDTQTKIWDTAYFSETVG